ncbi:ABC transporter substrate-binding protein [Thermomonospora cellulosilytica]|uniref:NitT/TauT family transport system substrate-binding protein n=1 Tax=Thermomonospora cellulosilytica TaxID=1411118 RepID=A0A7W3MZC5_9ACTN|nr:ABC transporter substrate-binding protein [Thermomonospora cellulosilytica]MBA9004671.1 NitT/TauT family transport system substrate-binding protein [Thermomonospora cellulosilytica]
MRQSRRRFGALAALLLVGSLTVGCGGGDSGSGGDGLEKETITVAALPLVDGAALHVGLKQKLFEAEGLKVQVKPVQQSIQALPALAKGDVDVIAGANYVTFLQAHEKGTLKLSILAEGAALTPNMMNVLVTPDSPIKSAKDLEGRKVAVNIPNNIQSLTLNAILKANNVDPTRIQYIQVPFPQMGAALEKGQVDAIHVVEPFLSDTQKKLGARVVVNGGGEPVTGVPISGYVTTQDFAAKNPKTAAAFQRAMLKAQQAAAGDRKRVEEVLPGYAHIEPQVASVITMPDFPTSVNTTRLQRIVDLMTTAGLLKSKPDLNTIVFQSKA